MLHSYLQFYPTLGRNEALIYPKRPRFPRDLFGAVSTLHVQWEALLPSPRDAPLDLCTQSVAKLEQLTDRTRQLELNGV